LLINFSNVRCAAFWIEMLKYLWMIFVLIYA
jgi:hypothetical protein